MSSAPLEPLAMIPGGMWEQVGWWDQVRRNQQQSYEARLNPPSESGEQLRELRLDLGLSQVEMGKRLGITSVYVCQMESGVRPLAAWVVPIIEIALANQPLTLTSERVA
jgi:DNA-binding XRE family transcriptional regulator